MARPGFPPMTQFSAAVTLIQWAQDHGRLPRCSDCAGSGGLHWFTTYYKTFQASTFSGVLELAASLLSGVELSSSIGDRLREMKPCMNAPACPEMIVDEGKHIRFCVGCRKRKQVLAAMVNTEALEPLLSRTRLERYGLGRDGWYSGLVEWGEEA